MVRNIIIGILVVGLGVCGFFLYRWNKNIKDLNATIVEREATIADNEIVMKTLNTQIDQLSKKVDVYETNGQEITSGSKLKMSMLKKVKVPSSTLVDDQFITDENLKDYLDKEFRFNIHANMILVKSMFRDPEQYDQPITELDVVLPYIPIGLKVGDYVSVILNVPKTSGYMVFERKKIEMMYDEVVKFYVTEAERILYEAMLYDVQMHSDKGVSWKVVKYIEDNEDQVPYYFVPDSYKPLIDISPNIKDRTRLINDNLRKYIDFSFRNMYTEKELEKYDPDAKLTSSYGLADNNKITSAHKKWLSEQEKKEGKTTENTEVDDGLME